MVSLCYYQKRFQNNKNNSKKAGAKKAEDKEYQVQKVKSFMVYNLLIKWFKFEIVLRRQSCQCHSFRLDSSWEKSVFDTKYIGDDFWRGWH